MKSEQSNSLMWRAAAPLLAFAFVLVGVRLLASNIHVDWSTWRQATCMPGACFCETVRRGTVRQIANTWSSLAFVLVGCWVIGVSTWDRNNRSGSRHSGMTQRAVYPWLFGSSLCVVGVGSAFYHASLTFAGQFADVFGMYLIGTFAFVYNIGRLRVLSDAAAFCWYLSLNIALALMLYFVPDTRRYLFAVVIVAALLVEYQVRQRALWSGSVRYLMGAVAALTVAFVVWALDLRRVLCSPESLWQGHAVWHVLGAVACAAVFWFWRSETTIGDDNSQVYLSL